MRDSVNALLPVPAGLPLFITRPRAQAAEIVQAIVRQFATQVVPHVCPLWSIVASAKVSTLQAVAARLQDYSLVIFASPNAVRYFLRVSAISSPWPAQVAVAVVGPGSLLALSEFGIVSGKNTIHLPSACDSVGGRAADAECNAESAPRFDSEALFATLQTQGLAGQRILLVKGQGGRPWLAQQLRAAGARLDILRVYRRRRVHFTAATQSLMNSLIAQRRDAAFLVTSSSAVSQLAKEVGELAGAAGEAWLHRALWLVTHHRIAENATAAGYSRIVLTDPDAAGIARALKCAGF